jgi:hypothetical protein
MSRNRYGTKFKEISWDVVDGTDQPLPLGSADLNFDPRRRAMMIFVFGMNAGNSLELQFSSDNTNWFTIGSAYTGATNYLINPEALTSVKRVRPRYVRLSPDATGADPGVATVQVIGKHIPSTMKKQ